MYNELVRIAVTILTLAGLLGTPVPGYSEEDDHAEHEEAESIALAEDVLEEQGVSLERTVAKDLTLTINLNGRLRTNEDRLVHLVPRFSGIIRDVSKKLGDKVKKGDLLMTVESNQTLQPYQVIAPIAGVVVKRHAAVGELAKESEEVFEIADLSDLWADFYVFPDEFTKVKEGQEVVITANGTQVRSVVSFVSAYVDPTTQSRFARAVVDNKAGALHPGQFIRGAIVQGRREAKVAVKTSALQQWESKAVVFVPRAGKILPQAVSLGAGDGDYTEITEGLSSGDEYYAGNVFVLKAELGKSLASHEH